MLREVLAALTTPASRYARRLGYVHEGIAIEARYRRCYTDWAPHIGRCHRAIQAATDECTTHNLVVVLGSGPLYDIPLDALAEAFSQVVLLDVFHPPRARRLLTRWPNVSALEHDLLGLDVGGADAADRAAGCLAGWRKKVPVADLVISANLLSQLPLIPLLTRGAARFRRRECEAEAWSRAIMQAHLDDLAAGPGRPCLISEWRRRWFDRNGNEVDSELPLSGVMLPAPSDCWSWTVAPPGELSGGASLVVDVGLYSL